MRSDGANHSKVHVHQRSGGLPVATAGIRGVHRGRRPLPVGKRRCFDVDVTSEKDVVWMLSVGLE